jgi:hypothetical protein
MKTCSGCGKAKEVSEFYVNKAAEDGLTYRCRVCLMEYQKSRRERLNASRPEGWKNKTKDMVEYMKAWKAANPGYMTQKKKEWYEKNRERLKVRDAVKYALRTGKLVRQPCAECGELNVHAHHADYSRPLDVVWLCPTHHNEVHS